MAITREQGGVLACRTCNALETLSGETRGPLTWRRPAWPSAPSTLWLDCTATDASCVMAEGGKAASQPKCAPCASSTISGTLYCPHTSARPAPSPASDSQTCGSLEEKKTSIEGGWLNKGTANRWRLFKGENDKEGIFNEGRKQGVTYEGRENIGNIPKGKNFGLKERKTLKA